MARGRAVAGPRILLVADEGLFREGIRAILASEKGAEVRTVGSAESARAAIDDKVPDVVVLDLESRVARESDLLPDLASRSSETRILVLTSSTESTVHSSAVRQGALGVVPKQSRAKSLVEAVARLRKGQVWLERTVLAPVLDRMLARERMRKPDPFERLTHREGEIVSLVCEGLTNLELARRLRISEATVRHHLTSIFAKLEVRDRVALVIAAFRRGMPAGRT